MNIQLHKAQHAIATDINRFVVVRAGRRFGKTTLAAPKITKWAVERHKKALQEQGHNVRDDEDIVFPIITPTLGQGKSLYWNKLKTLIPPEWVTKRNESDLIIRLKNGNVLMLYGSDKNPDKLRGIKIGGFLIDEVDSIRNWSYLWEEVIRPATTDLISPGLFIGTPKGYSNMYSLEEKAKTDKDYKAFHFTTYDNPFIPKEEIEKAKAELSEEAFAQEYLAEYKRYTGLVYKDFKREVHVISPIELGMDWTFYRGIDFGFVNPSSCNFYAVDKKGIIYQYDEVYQSGLQTPDLAEIIKQKSAGRHFADTVADSAQQADIQELIRYGISCRPVSKTSGTRTEDWASFKIRKVTEKLRNGKFFVFSNCINTINEFENYQYTEINEGSQRKEVPLKVNDHSMDATAYFIVSLPERIEAEYFDFEIGNFPSEEQPLFDKTGFY